jgi:hypothetical protein
MQQSARFYRARRARQIARTLYIDRMSSLRLGLSPIYRRICRRIDDERRLERFDSLTHRLDVTDVQFGVNERAHLHACWRLAEHRPADLPGCTGDEYFH